MRPEDFWTLFPGTLEELLLAHPELKFTIAAEHWSTDKSDISGNRVGKADGKAVAGEFEDSRGRLNCWYYPTGRVEK
jgi:hypothetical protein